MLMQDGHHATLTPISRSGYLLRGELKAALRCGCRCQEVGRNRDLTARIRGQIQEEAPEGAWEQT
jgi:hypothetical protein